MKTELKIQNRYSKQNYKPNFQGFISNARYKFAKKEIDEILNMKIRLYQNINDAFERQKFVDEATDWAKQSLKQLELEFKNDINKNSKRNIIIEKIKNLFK